MRNEAFDILKDIPKWKLIFWLLLAITLTPITELIIYRLVTSVIESSLTLSELGKEFIRIFGYEKYKGIKESLWMMIVSYLFLFSIFSSYLYIFYRHERKLYYETCIKKMIEE
ncbi:TPA: two-component sensor histidine kinase, partial [Bacillus anthracis]|nr:two-component sensor histidine kinase [Bacillus anthracis]HDR5260937.1 two-component sensor histidine kinase [Bacillus anthracis]